jgi:hypothetical protein
MSENDIETPIDDALEQRQSVAEDAEDAEEPFDDDEPGDLPFEVNEADAAEQQRTVELDEDDYR